MMAWCIGIVQVLLAKSIFLLGECWRGGLGSAQKVVEGLLVAVAYGDVDVAEDDAVALNFAYLALLHYE